MVTYESIVRDVLDEPVESLVRVDEGWTNIVLEVDGKWIFRFDRDPSNTQLAVEQAFLPLFKGHSPLPIPEIRYSGANFIAYEKIVGVKFSEAIFRNLDRNERRTLAAALGNFLSSLHAIASLNTGISKPHRSAAVISGGSCGRPRHRVSSPIPGRRPKAISIGPYRESSSPHPGTSLRIRTLVPITS